MKTVRERTVKVLAAAGVVAGLALGGVSTSWAGSPPMTVEPTTVTYDEEFTISGEGCSTQVVVGVSGIPGSQASVTPAPDGTWSTTRVALSEAGIPTGTLTVFASCLEPAFEYIDVEVTLTATGPTTPTTATPTTVTPTTVSAAATAATASPRFTG